MHHRRVCLQNCLNRARMLRGKWRGCCVNRSFSPLRSRSPALSPSQQGRASPRPTRALSRSPRACRRRRCSPRSDARSSSTRTCRSRAGTSCASCHDPERAFAGSNHSTNGLPRGSRPGHFARRASPSLLYLRYVPDVSLRASEQRRRYPGCAVRRLLLGRPCRLDSRGRAPGAAEPRRDEQPRRARGGDEDLQRDLRQRLPARASAHPTKMPTRRWPRSVAPSRHS